MAKAKKLKSGNWRCLAYIGKDSTGKRQYKSFTAPTKKEAELMALTYEQETTKDPAEDMTLGEVIDQYTDLKTNILSASTLREYRRIREHCYPGLFMMKVSEITSVILQTYINEEAASSSSKTVKNRFSFILSALKEYYPEKTYRIKYPPKKKRDATIPTENEMAKIWEHVKGTEMEIPVLLAAFVGMRRGEICALDNISKTGRLKIDKVVVLNETGSWVIQNRAKTEAGNRTAFAPPFVAELLRKHPLPITLTPNQISDRFRTIIKELNLPPYRFHDLRHFYASALMSAGVPDKYVIERIGHSTDHMLKTVYQHTMKEKNEQIDATITTVFTGVQHKMQHNTD